MNFNLYFILRFSDVQTDYLSTFETNAFPDTPDKKFPTDQL